MIWIFSNKLFYYFKSNKQIIFFQNRVSLIEGRPWNEVYDFIFDRLRAVRQDMTIQQIGGMEAVSLLEDTVRFYIYSGYRYYT